MHLPLITPTDWQTQQWKNGGGITHELAAECDEKGLLWRISIAEVKSDAPFSFFSGIDRIITVLEGKGFELKFPDGSSKIIQCFDTPLESAEPFSFSGEEAITCHLIDGLVRDFNVMTRRGSLQAALEIMKLKINEPQKLSLPASSKQFIYVARGSVQLRIDKKSCDLGQEDALLIHDSTSSFLNLVSGEKSAIVFCVTLTIKNNHDC